jgi:predicted Zn-dependent peptidase
MGNNVGSRLWYLRQKEKLAYAVYTQYITDKFGAAFRAAIGTDTSKVKTALNSLNREWDMMVNDGVTAEELRDAKINMKNNLIYRIDRKSNRANYMAYYEHLGYGYRFVLDLIEKADNITLDELNQFVKNRFSADRKFVSIVGKK